MPLSRGGRIDSVSGRDVCIGTAKFFRWGHVGATSREGLPRRRGAVAATPRRRRVRGAVAAPPRRGRVRGAVASTPRRGRVCGAVAPTPRRGRVRGGVTSQPQPRGCHRGATNLRVPSLPPPGPTPTMWDHGLLRNHNLSPGPAHVEAFFVCFRGAGRPAGAAICNECAGCRFGAGSTDAGPSSNSLFPAGQRGRAVHKELLVTTLRGQLDASHAG